MQASGLEDLRASGSTSATPVPVKGHIEILMDKLGWTMEDFARFGTALASNPKRSAITASMPSSSRSSLRLDRRAVTTCDAQLVSIEGEAVDALVEENPYYFKAVIPAGTYNNEEDVHTYGVGATVVSSTRTDADVIYEVVKAIFENFESFTSLHPAFGALEKETMVTQGNSAPLHEGAQRYFEEVGLL